MDVAFILPDSSMQRRIFTKRPIGIDFNRQMPVTVKHVRCPGPSTAKFLYCTPWRQMPSYTL